MKDLRNMIEESLLDSELVDNVDNKVILDGLFSEDKTMVKKVIDELKNMVVTSGAKQIKTTNKIKSSNNFFIQFSAYEGQTYDMILLKRYGSNWYAFCVSINDRRMVDFSFRIEGWNSIQPNISPKDALMYMVPDSMNELCKDIMHSAQK